MTREHFENLVSDMDADLIRKVLREVHAIHPHTAAIVEDLLNARLQCKSSVSQEEAKTSFTASDHPLPAVRIAVDVLSSKSDDDEEGGDVEPVSFNSASPSQPPSVPQHVDGYDFSTESRARLVRFRKIGCFELVRIRSFFSP